MRGFRKGSSWTKGPHSGSDVPVLRWFCWEGGGDGAVKGSWGLLISVYPRFKLWFPNILIYKAVPGLVRNRIGPV